MVPTARLIEILGGKGVVRERQATNQTLIEKARAGLPYMALETVAERFEIPQQTLMRILHLPPRTLARRKKTRRLGPDESDRLLRLARVAAMAEDVLGEPEKAGSWLSKRNRALGGASPLDLLDTDLGVSQVETILVQIEHGVHS